MTFDTRKTYRNMTKRTGALRQGSECKGIRPYLHLEGPLVEDHAHGTDESVQLQNMQETSKVMAGVLQHRMKRLKMRSMDQARRYEDGSSSTPCTYLEASVGSVYGSATEFIGTDA